MPTPSGSSLENAIRSNLPGDIFVGHPKFDEFMAALGKGWNKAWVSWQAGIIGGFNNVSGVGLGLWSGKGGGGTIVSAGVINILIEWPFRVPRILEWEAALNQIMTKEYNTWVSTYIFAIVNYSGSSTATGVSSGVVNAVNIPAPIGTLGAGLLPTELRSQVETILTGNGWDVKNEFYQMGNFLDAMQAAIDQEFTKWINALGIFTGDIYTGSAAAGSGSSSGTSKGTGLIL